MKKEIIKGVLIGICCVLMYIGMGYSQTHYTRYAEVTATRNDEVEVTDLSGEVWVFYGEGFEVGDKVALNTYNNHTEDYIYDDEIVGAKLLRQ